MYSMAELQVTQGRDVPEVPFYFKISSGKLPSGEDDGRGIVYQAVHKNDDNTFVSYGTRPIGETTTHKPIWFRDINYQYTDVMNIQSMGIILDGLQPMTKDEKEDAVVKDGLPAKLRGEELYTDGKSYWFTGKVDGRTPAPKRSRTPSRGTPSRKTPYRGGLRKTNRKLRKRKTRR